jgi:hypothetical protein
MDVARITGAIQAENLENKKPTAGITVGFAKIFLPGETGADRGR